MKKFIVVICCILLQIIVMSGCISEEHTTPLNPSPEVITVSGVDITRVITYRDKPIKLMVSGSGNDVTVSKDTNLVDVMLSGIDCIVRVSKSHSFTSTVSGVGSQIIYYD